MKKTLNTIADIKQHFAENTVPYYFISASNFNLMDMHNWVKHWTNINLIDCFDKQHPNVLMIENDYSRVFDSIEDINAYLLAQEKTRNAINTSNTNKSNDNGRAIFLFFDEQLEKTCAELHLDICLPKNALVREIDSKIITTEIGNNAGVMSVPNVLTKVNSYAHLREIASKHHLGERLVVQLAYGDSGKTTFFIANESEYADVAEDIEAAEQVKIMRRIRCSGTAIEACATRWGTFVGPLLTELIGIESLTPYAGGWCGNELYQEAFSPAIRQQVLTKTQAMGDALYQRGYHGYFELDYLIDLDTDEVYLGELNARITGISAMTNMSDYSAKTIPLFLFHLLEYDPAVNLTLDVNRYNQDMLQQGAQGTAAQLIYKYTDSELRIITQAPVTGTYKLENNGQLRLLRPGYNRRDALQTDECFILRIMNTTEYAYKGGDLAILFINTIIRDNSGSLNDTGNTWVSALGKCFTYRSLTLEEQALLERYYHPTTLKGSNA